MNYPRIIQVLL